MKTRRIITRELQRRTASKLGLLAAMALVHLTAACVGAQLVEPELLQTQMALASQGTAAARQLQTQEALRITLPPLQQLTPTPAVQLPTPTTPALLPQPSPTPDLLSTAALPLTTETIPLPTVVTPTATSVPQPTDSGHPEGSVLRAEYDPAANWGEPDVSERFDGPDGLFTIGTSDTSNSWYADGVYQITFNTRGWWVWYYGDVEVGNYFADTLAINGDECVDRDSAGMMIRLNQASDFGFLFGINCAGKYYVGITGGPGASGPVCTFRNVVFDDPSDWECAGIPYVFSSEFAAAGPGAINRLGVRARANQYDLYINGHLVRTLYDQVTAARRGFPGLFLGAGQKEKSAVKFDDFSLWRDR